MMSSLAPLFPGRAAQSHGSLQVAGTADVQTFFLFHLYIRPAPDKGPIFPLYPVHPA